MAPKELFLRNKDQVKSALAILKADAFDLLMIFAKAEFAARNPTNEQMVGANEFERTLRGMADVGDVPTDFPQPGLEHNLEVVRKKLGDQNPQNQ